MIRPFEAKCVQQPETNGVTYFTNSNFVLSWKFQNAGETAWPLDTMFMQAHGDQDMGALPWSVGKSVKPGEEIEIFVEFNAPAKAGLFQSFFRLSHGDNIQFGQKVWVVINLQERVPVPEVEEDLKVKVYEPALV